MAREDLFFLYPPFVSPSPQGLVSSYDYDAAGRLVSCRQQVGQVVYSTGYSYDGAGNLRQVDYPTGLVVRYEADSVDPMRVARVVIEAGGQVKEVARVLGYRPFGPASRLRFGSGLEESWNWDLNGQVVAIRAGTVEDRLYRIDDLGRVTGIEDRLDPGRSQQFGYDGLGRLTFAQGPYGTIDYGYDKVGNRLYRNQDSYRYEPGTNRLEVITGQVSQRFRYDADGNIVERLIAASAAEPVEPLECRYHYNGQRVVKQTASATVVFHYDFDGHLIAETDAAGATICNYVWLEGRPLAQVDAAGNVYFYHTDHLGTPQRMTDETGAVVWSADYFPFGKADVTIETVVNNLRFAGQYYDSETGLHYNYHRYYDPSLGRYLRPDPLNVGSLKVLAINSSGRQKIEFTQIYMDILVNPHAIQLYEYCVSNPINFTDPNGQKALRDMTRKDFLDLAKKYKVCKECKDIEDHLDSDLDEQCSKCCEALGKLMSIGQWHAWWAQCAAMLCL